MQNLKEILIFLVVFSTLIQTGNIMLSKTGYENIFRFASGFLLVISVICFFSSFEFGENSGKYISEKDFEISEINIKTEFENRLEKTIAEDIHNIFYVNYNIRVETDFKKLKIYLENDSDYKAYEIKEYIKNHYCTADDEVIIVNEAG